MRKCFYLTYVSISLLASCNQQTATTASTSFDTAIVKKEVIAFMNKYQDLTRANDYAGIATLYDSSGAAFVNLEKVDYESYDTIKSQYNKMSVDTIKFFKWQEPMIIDPIRMDIATVSTSYHLYIGSFNDTLKARYSSVLIKSTHGWKIKQETEMPEIMTVKKMLEFWENNK